MGRLGEAVLDWVILHDVYRCLVIMREVGIWWLERLKEIMFKGKKIMER